MLLTIIYFIPSLVSLLWLTLFILKKKSSRQVQFCRAIAFSVLFYAMLAMYVIPGIDYSHLVRANLVFLPAALCFPVFLIPYVHMLHKDSPMRNRAVVLSSIPVIVEAVALWIITYIVGFDQAAGIAGGHFSRTAAEATMNSRLSYIYGIVQNDLFAFLICVYSVSVLLICLKVLKKYGYRSGDFGRFLVLRQATPRSVAIVFFIIIEILLLVVTILLGAVYVSAHPVAGVAFTLSFALLEHFIAYMEFFSDDPRSVTLFSLSHLSFPGYSEESPSVSPSAVPVAAPETRHDRQASDTRIGKRAEQLRLIMQEEKLWMDENLDAALLCEKMGISKATLSQIVSQSYDMSLRELIAKYRIEEAKSYMLSHPKATQETVAQHCGFKNAQYFNAQFKKLVGDTPAMWRLGHD